mgnify:CR=1 FL=1
MTIKHEVEKIMALLQITQRKPIWSQYRQVLKQKYGSQWNFLVNHFDEILPMDVQTFFFGQYKSTASIL